MDRDERQTTAKTPAAPAQTLPPNGSGTTRTPLDFNVPGQFGGTESPGQVNLGGPGLELASPSTIRLREVNRAAAADAKVTKMIRIFMCVSFLMDVTLLILTALTIPGYVAVTRDTYLDNGTSQPTKPFIRAREPVARADVENSQKSTSKAGIIVASILVALYAVSLVMDVWFFLIAKSLQEPPKASGHLCSWFLRSDPFGIWGILTFASFMLSLGQVYILVMIIIDTDGRPAGGRCGKYGREECKPRIALYMFPEGIDYSLERDKWDSTIAQLQKFMFVAFVVTCILPIMKALGVWPWVHLHEPPTPPPVPAAAPPPEES